MNQTNAQQRRLTRAAEEGNVNRKYGFWIFLSSEFLIFAGLIGAFVMTRASVFRTTSTIEEFFEKWWEPNTLSIALVSINTFILLASSLFVVLGIEAIRRDDKAGLVKWLFATIVMGVLFLGGQAIEYTTLAQEGHTYFNNADPFASAFFTLTGFHGLHVFAGTRGRLLVRQLHHGRDLRPFLALCRSCVGVDFHHRLSDLTWPTFLRPIPSTRSTPTRWLSL
jgi:cytochrome c oxidase subunit III